MDRCYKVAIQVTPAGHYIVDSPTFGSREGADGEAEKLAAQGVGIATTVAINDPRASTPTFYVLGRSRVYRSVQPTQTTESASSNPAADRAMT